MDVYDFTDYKAVIRERVREQQERGHRITLKAIALRVPMQYTYLSRALNRADTQLGEDHLFSILELLEFADEEKDYVLLLRSYQSSSESRRRRFLFKKIASLRKARAVSATTREAAVIRLEQELTYFLDPLCLVTYVALHLPEIRRTPRLLAERLGISLAQVKETLKTLERVDFLRLKPGGLEVEALLQGNVHYGVDHPLTRVHQALMKTAATNQLLRTAEERKQSFQVTFTMDRKGFEKVRSDWRVFVKKLEDTARAAKKEHVYHLNFDFLEWF